jgi:DNA-binding Lrp family transcriptional regulator
MKNNKQDDQFTMIPHSLMSNKDLTDQDKLTLSLILSFINNDKEFFMGNEIMAERLGITKNAASKRIQRLEKLGCIELSYTYKKDKKEVDKRYIIITSLTPQVSSDRLQVSSDRLRGIVPQTTGYSLTDSEVSSKQGGIIQPDYTSVLDKEVNKLEDKVLDKEKPFNELTPEERNKALQLKYEYEKQLKELTIKL